MLLYLCGVCFELCYCGDKVFGILNMTDTNCCVYDFCLKISFYSNMSSDLPPKIFTSTPQLRCCAAPMFRELKASAAVGTWPIMKLKSSSSSPILSRCWTLSPTSSHCLAKRAANRCRASKVTMFRYRLASQCCSRDALRFFNPPLHLRRSSRHPGRPHH